MVRSSAPAEDTAAASFAGLHESYVNVRGVTALLEAVRQVWASLGPTGRSSIGRSWGSTYSRAAWPWWSRKAHHG